MPGRVAAWCIYSSPSTSTNMNGNVHFTPYYDPLASAEYHPMPRPSSDTAYSYERWMFFKCTEAPINALTNFKVWSATRSSPATGVILRASTTGSYPGASNNESTVATSLFHNVYPSYSTPLNVGGSLTSIGDNTGFFVIQCEVNSAAQVGAVDSPSTIIHFAFDES